MLRNCGIINYSMRYLFIFIIMKTVHSVAMDPVATEATSLATTMTQSSLAPLIHLTDTAINLQCAAYTEKKQSSTSLKVNELSEKKMFKILEIVQQHNPTITTSFIKALKNKNNFFMKTIDYFCELASENLAAVTIATLDTINNPLRPQPITQLDKLVSPIKEY